MSLQWKEHKQIWQVFAVRQENFLLFSISPYYALTDSSPWILHDVHTKLDDVPRTYLMGLALLRPPTQPIIVDKCAIATLCVL